MSTAVILDICLYAALAMLMLAMLITAVRVVLGPTLADRVLALDQLVAIAIGFIAVIAVRTGYELYIDIALALGLAGFLATAAFARYIFISSKGNKKTDKIEEE
jgi:multicomponent Na+:H+ antiporter subunit F